MSKKTTEKFEASLVNYLIEEYFESDAGAFAKQVGYTKQQVGTWRTGKRKPQKATIRWLLSATIAPEFKVAAEFVPVKFVTKSEILPQLSAALKEHGNMAGVYAFYDSMCSLIYVGKASSKLITEMYQQLRNPLGIKFPRAVVNAPAERWEAVRYVSAYEIPIIEHLDYPKHVEALVLRLSKPIGNKILGKLERSAPPKEE